MVGDVIDVKDSYGRNYLIPQHLAVQPTTANMKALEDEKRLAAERRAAIRSHLEETANRLKNVEVTISAVANEEGRLYGSVGPREIASALRDEGYAVETAQVELHDPFRALDSKTVTIRLTADVTTEVKVWVVRERAAGVLDEPETPTGQRKHAGSEADTEVSEGGDASS
jgi:large subunit ribosomal protein L9